MILSSNLTSGKWNTFSLSLSPHRRKDDFKLYVEPFRPLNEVELKSITRIGSRLNAAFGWATEDQISISYQAQMGGFTICNIILDNKLYSGSSHCLKTDRWLPIRGKMFAFRRALESEGMELLQIQEKVK